MRYNILSNGTLINEKILSQFEKGKRRLRLDFIQISIDGSTARIHNKSRPNSFARSIKASRLLAIPILKLLAAGVNSLFTPESGVIFFKGE